MFPPYSASDYGNENGPGVSLVEIEPGVAVVMGDRPLESMGLPAEFDCEDGFRPRAGAVSPRNHESHEVWVTAAHVRG